MRPIFLIFLFLTLLSAGLSIHAAGNIVTNGTSGSQVKIVKKVDQVPYTEHGHRHIAIKRAGLTEVTTSFLSDEDDDNMSARKYLLPALCALILYYAIVFCLHRIYSRERLPFCNHLCQTGAYKNIFQRSLRL